jgi:hypothetical protein
MNKGELLMLKKARKGTLAFTAAAVMAAILCTFVFAYADIGDSEELTVKPIYEFSNKSKRDPFVPRQFRNLLQSNRDVVISTLLLEGITLTNESKTALFMNRSGGNFSYILADGIFYGENNTPIPEITGEIRNENEVMLRQGDREILFKMSKEATGSDIKPSDE